MFFLPAIAALAGLSALGVRRVKRQAQAGPAADTSALGGADALDGDAGPPPRRSTGTAGPAWSTLAVDGGGWDRKRWENRHALQQNTLAEFQAREGQAERYTAYLHAGDRPSGAQVVAQQTATKAAQEIPVVGPVVAPLVGAFTGFVVDAFGPSSVPIIDPATGKPFQLTAAERQAIADDQRPFILARKTGADERATLDLAPIPVTEFDRNPTYNPDDL